MSQCTRYAFWHVREMHAAFKGTFPQAERGMHGADGRWLWRGAVEELYGIWYTDECIHMFHRLRQDRLLQRKGMKVPDEVPEDNWL